MEALLDALRGQPLLRLLPGQGLIGHNGARQEDHPGRQASQDGPAIASFFGLKSGQGPTQSVFAKMQPGFYRPAMIISPPDGLDRQFRFSW